MIDQECSDDHLVKKGRMKKFPLHMTPDELAEWKIQVAKNIREYLFSIGQPLVYSKDGQMVAEYADGRIDFLESNPRH